MIDDPDIQAIAAQQRSARLQKIGIALVVVLGGVLAVVPTGGAVASHLQEDGHTDVEVERQGVFAFAFTSKKGDAQCSGTVRKMPGSMSTSQSCITRRAGK